MLRRSIYSFKRFLISAAVISFCYGCDEKISIIKKDEKPSFESTVTGSLLNSPIREASGIAPSYKYPGFYWTHNDSQDSARIFLIDSTGRIKATIFLENIKNRDWEDIATSKDASGKSFIHIADIGDNFLSNDFNYIYRISEPELSHTFNQRITINEIQKVVFTYPDGKKDSETLLVDSASTSVFVISKSDSLTNIYTFPENYKLKDTTVLINKGTFAIPGIVGGSISPNSNSILLKSYSKIYYWEKSTQKDISNLLKESPISIPYQVEPQGEAICWNLNSKDFITVTECVSFLSCNIKYHRRN